MLNFLRSQVISAAMPPEPDEPELMPDKTPKMPRPPLKLSSLLLMSSGSASNFCTTAEKPVYHSFSFPLAWAAIAFASTCCGRARMAATISTLIASCTRRTSERPKSQPMARTS